MTLYRRWFASFAGGNRLDAEVNLQASSFAYRDIDIELEYLYLLRSYGFDVALPPNVSPFEALPSGGIHSACKNYEILGKDDPRRPALDLADFPDPLLNWAVSCSLPSSTSPKIRRDRFLHIAQILYSRFSGRPDLILQLIASEGAFPVLKSLPYTDLSASAFYTNIICSLFYFQSLWAKGHYFLLYTAYLCHQVHRRATPSSDFLVRVLTVLGHDQRSAELFRSVYSANISSLQPQTISNMIFTELGLCSLRHSHVANLVADFRKIDVGSPSPLDPERLSMCINEKPLLVVASADLRMHPVGRFWLPLLRRLSLQYRVAHIAFNPFDDDYVRTQIRNLSFEWYPIDSDDDVAPLLRKLKPQILLELGGHTADNRPWLLNQRFAAVQASYLGFYGPSYAVHCDWWILDKETAARVSNSYPDSEPIWTLSCPSLCFDPEIHGLPHLDDVSYVETRDPVFGSFNHTRKLTQSCISRFASVMEHNKNATLFFRSHSFYDQSVRRWFLRSFIEAGVAPDQIMPLPYAPTPAESLLDYQRVHLHLDSFPVCGTTTTLDSMAMGIPVLTCPNSLYAGAISASLIEQAGYSDWVVDDPSDLPAKAFKLYRQYHSARARKNLAHQVRNSQLCDTRQTPIAFADELKSMLCASSLS